MLFVGGFLGAFLISLILTFVGTPLYERIGLVDIPDASRKKHAKVTAFGGGIGIILATLGTGAVMQWYSGHFTQGLITPRHLFGILLASVVILVYGFLDDRHAVRPQIAILGPFVVALITLWVGFDVSQVSHPFGGEIAVLPWISAIGVFIWMMVMMYSTKVADGVDGLVGSLGFVAATVIAVLAFTTKYFQPDVALMALIVAGAILGFLIFNWAPASIFLGEIGSVWIGYMIGILAIISGSKLLTALMVLALPVTDLAFVMMRRVLSGASVWKGDRLHLHHLLIDRGWRSASIVGLYLCVSLILGGLSLILQGWQKILILILLSLLIFSRFVIAWYAQRSKE